MSNLFATLTSAARALEAQRVGLDVTGQNIANVNTPGYARRVVDMAAVPPETPLSAGRGVDVTGIRAMRDRLIERRLEQELAAERREAAAADAMSVVEASLGEIGESVDQRMQELFDSFARLAESPTSPVARQEVVLQGGALARAVRDMAARLRSSQRDVDTRVRAAVEEVNGLTSRIAAINKALGTATGGASLHLQDEQAVLVRRLSELVDIGVVARSDGGVDVTFGSGRSLVIGETAFALETESTAPYGIADITAGGTVVTDEITGGTLGGMLRVRDVNTEDYLARLDHLAATLATSVNALHTSGFDANGNPGVDFFTFSRPIGDPPVGAAEAIEINAVVAADPGLVAAASTPLAGDNGNARELAALRHAAVDGGSTLTELWSGIVYRVGRDAQAAVNEQSSRRQIVEQVERLRDQVSGISLDEEAMQLMKFQRAYEASARFFRAVDQALDILFDSLR
jgi:flagellar hook-associated protein 1 FlgK